MNIEQVLKSGVSHCLRIQIGKRRLPISPENCEN